MIDAGGLIIVGTALSLVGLIGFGAIIVLGDAIGQEIRIFCGVVEAVHSPTLESETTGAATGKTAYSTGGTADA